MLGVQYSVSTTVGFTGNQGKLGNRSFAIGIEQFSAVANDSSVLLIAARKETWNIHQGA